MGIVLRFQRDLYRNKAVVKEECSIRVSLKRPCTDSSTARPHSRL